MWLNTVKSWVSYFRFRIKQPFITFIFKQQWLRWWSSQSKPRATWSHKIW